jgi:hypothetical protein
VVPEIAAMRVIIAQAGEHGALLVRNFSADAVTQTTLYGALRTILIGLWIACGIWALLPIVAGGRTRTRMGRLVVSGFGVAVLIGAFTPQPLLSDTLREALAMAEETVAPARAALAQWAGNALTERAIAAPAGTGWTTASRGAESVGPAAHGTAGAGPSGARSPAVAAAAHAPAPAPPLDWSPRLNSDEGHILGFLLLAAALPFGFTRVPRLHLFAYLMLLGISIEMIQGFTVSRSAEFSDVVRDLIGSAAGLAWSFAWERRHSFRLPGRLERARAP